MTGGLLNIVSYGNQNVILNSNPKKSFFKTTYAKHTNFGLQKFRIDFTGQRNLRMSEESRFTFTVPRYAKLIMDTYLVVTLPTIWSPIYPPISCGDAWRPYEFRWIENLGTQMIKEITFSVGGQLLQRMTGKYLLAQIQRDLNGTKRFLYDTMTGNTAELNDPANFSGRRGTYPNVYYNTSQQGPEPSIRGRKIYIPLNAWFCNNSRTAFPLVALQYNELQIDVVMRPVRDLFVTRDINYAPPTTGTLTPAQVAQAPFIQPNFNEQQYQFYRFLQPPPAADISTSDVYSDKRTDWNADVHLLSTYCFLSAEESRVFASQEQKYLLKSAYEWDFKNITGSHRVELQNTMGMVATWMFMFQRSDINLRNQWSNYTNWAYANVIPDDVTPAPATGTFINPCDIITQTVLDLDYYKTYAPPNSKNATIVVPATSVSQFAVGQTITVTYDASNTITGTITSIVGTSITFSVTGVTTNAVPVVPSIYDNTSSTNQFWFGLTSTVWIFNNPTFPQPPNSTSGNNYIFQTVTVGLDNTSPSTASVTLQINDPVSGSIYVSPITHTISPGATVTLTYPFYNCIIPNGHNNVNIQYNSTQVINWETTTLNSVSYFGTVTGYPVSYTSGVVTVNAELPTIGPGLEPSGTPSGLFITQDYNVENQREILQQLGILLNGSYRENMLEAGVYNYVEKYIRTAGSAPFGLYIYNFGLDADNDTYQPSGAINMSKFSTIELEFSTYPPPLDPSANFYTICDPNSDPGVPIGVNKPQWRIYQYNYDLTVLEERYNVLTFIGGNCALMYAR
jgi:hypothetical protein